MLRILADENIPFVREAFGRLGAVRVMGGRDMSAADCSWPDALLVRSVTPVGARLLAGGNVRFVGSATIGTDHIDLEYLRERSIAFAHARGSNAESVVEYVIAALLLLARREGAALRKKTIGIVGCGHVGKLLATRASALGLRVVTNDPPLARHAEISGESHDFIGLDILLRQADIITLHVPLTLHGADKTCHLLDAHRLKQLTPGAWLINTSRGGVIDARALRAFLESGRLGILDVWDNEPNPDPSLVRLAAVATPHIAGHSYDGKLRGTIMLHQAVVQRFGLRSEWDPTSLLRPGMQDRLEVAAPAGMLAETPWLHDLVQQMYDLQANDARMRGLLAAPPERHAAFFSELRRSFPRRRAFHLHRIARAAVPKGLRHAVEEGLGLQLSGEG